MFQWIIRIRHWKYRLPIKDNYNWGYRCRKCESKEKGIVWHKLPFFVPHVRIEGNIIIGGK